jgi:hypothetical protein
MKGLEVRAVLVAIVLALLVSPVAALAQSADSEWTYTVAVSLWARPAIPGAMLDAYDPALADAVEQLLFFYVVDFPRAISQEEFASAYQELVVAAGIVDPTPLTPSPGLLTDSVAFAGEGEGFAASVIVAYENDLMYVAMELDTSGEANDGSAFDDLVRGYLASIRQSPAPPLMEALESGFVDNAQFRTERPLGLLPSRSDIPADFQLLDKDLLLVDDPSFDIFGGGS